MQRVSGSLAVPGQRRSGHVRLDADGHGDAAAADAAQLLRHGHAVAEVQAQASILCRGVGSGGGGGWVWEGEFTCKSYPLILSGVEQTETLQRSRKQHV